MTRLYSPNDSYYPFFSLLSLQTPKYYNREIFKYLKELPNLNLGLHLSRVSSFILIYNFICYMIYSREIVNSIHIKNLYDTLLTNLYVMYLARVTSTTINYNYYRCVWNEGKWFLKNIFLKNK